MKTITRPFLMLGLAAALGAMAAPGHADPTVPVELAQSAPAPDDANADLQFWNQVKDSKTAADYQAYLDKFPNGSFADLAKIRVKQYGGDAAVTAPTAPTETTPTPANAPDSRLVELDFWNEVKNSKDPADYKAYLNKYPNGEFVDLAKLRITQLTPTPAPAPTPVVQQPAQPASPTPPVQPNPPVQPVAVTTPAPMPDFAGVDAKVYAKSSARVRSSPDKNAAVLAKVATNTELAATGKTADGAWWRVTLADGRTGYLAGSLVSDKPVAVAPPAPSKSSLQSAAPAGPDEEVCKLTSSATPNDRVAACERLANKSGLDDAAHRDALLNQAAALDVAHRYDDSIRKYEQAAALSPLDATIYYRIGLVRLEQKRFPEARAAFDKAATLDNKNPDYVFERGVAAAGFGDFAKARDEAKRALLTKDDVHYYEKVGEYELALGDVAAAKTAIERGRKVDGTFSSLATAAVDYYGGSFDLAATEASAVANAAGDPAAGLWRALALRAKGDAAGAAAALESGRAALGDKDWPAPIYDHLMGKLSADKLLVMAKTSDPRAQAERICMARFYAGEWAFLGGDTATARSDLQNATNAQAFHLLEHAAAKARLANMTK